MEPPPSPPAPATGSHQRPRSKTCRLRAIRGVEMTGERATGQRPALPRLLFLSKVAAQLDVSIKTVHRAIKRGELPVHRIGRQDRVSDWDLAAYIALRRKSPGSGLRPLAATNALICLFSI